MSISVIMPSFLGFYIGSASNREIKMYRAINSFLSQGIGELVVVSDGCKKTVDIIRKYNRPNIKLVEIEKQPLFSGNVRQAGINEAQYGIICYLDTDDEFKPNHLQSILDQMSDNDWVYYDDYLGRELRVSRIERKYIGTSCIAHKKDLPVVWGDGYGHDFFFIQELVKLNRKYSKINNTGYQCNHIPNVIDI